MKVLGKVLSTAIAVLLVFSLISCDQLFSGKDTESHTNYSLGVVSGVVTEGNGTALKGVQGARVTMGPYSATTNKDGVWSITGVKPGDYTAYISKDGYSEASVTGISVDPKKYESLNLKSSIELKKALLETISNLGISQTFSTSSDEEDELSLGLGAVVTDNYTIEEDLLSWFDTSVPEYEYEYAIVAAAANIKPLSAGLKGSIKLRTYTTEDGGVADMAAGEGVVIAVYDASKEYLYASAVTDENGVFEIEKGLPAFVSTADLTIVIEPFAVDGYVYRNSDAACEKDQDLLPDQIIDVQTFCVEGSPVEDCITVTTNIGAKTVFNPLKLEDDITFTFDREVLSVGFTLDNDYVKDVNYTISVSTAAGKTTVKLSPVADWAGLSKVTISSLKTTDGYKEDALVQSEYPVEFDDALLVTAASFYDPEDSDKVIEVKPTDDITVTFDKDIAYVKSITFTDIELRDVAVSGKTVTIPAAKATDGKFTGTNLKMTVVATDRSSATVNKTVTYDGSLKVTAASFYDVNDSLRTVEVAPSAAITLTFNKDIKWVTSLSFTGYSKEDAVVSGKTVTLTPKTIDGKFTATTFGITVVAKDGTSLTLPDKSVTYAAFKLLSMSIVEQSAIPGTAAARAATTKTVSASQAVKLSFNMNVGSTYHVQYAGENVVAKVDGKDVYVLFDDKVNTNAASAITGKVYAENGEEADIGTLLEDYNFLANTEYEIIGVNWAGKGSSVNGTVNDSSVADKLGISDSVELTFNKAFASGSVVTAELYKQTEVNNSVSKKSYANTAVVNGNKVIITPAARFEKSTKYAVSFKVVKDGITLFTTRRGVADDEILFAEDETSGVYVEFTTKGNPALKKGVKDKTTVGVYTTSEKILPDDSVFLEYDDSVAEYAFYATYDSITTPEETKAAFEVSEDYLEKKLDATITREGNTVVKIDPNGVLNTSKIYVYVFDETGKYISDSDVSVSVDTATSLKCALENPVAAIKPVLVTAASDIDSVTLGFNVKVASLKTLHTDYKIYKSVRNAYGNYSDYSSVGTTVSSTFTDIVRGISEYTIAVSKTKTDQVYGPVKYIASVVKGGLITASTVLEVADSVKPVVAEVYGSIYKVDPNDKTKVFAKTDTFNNALNKKYTLTLSEDVIVDSVVLTPATASADAPVATWAYNSTVSNAIDITLSKAIAQGDKVTVKVHDPSANENTIVISTLDAPELTFNGAGIKLTNSTNNEVTLAKFNAGLAGGKIVIASDCYLNSVNYVTVDGTVFTGVSNVLSDDHRSIEITLIGTPDVGGSITVSATDLCGNSIVRLITVIANN